MKKALITFVFVALNMLVTNQALAFGIGPLQKAVVANDLNLVKQLLAHGEDINSRHCTKGRTALMLASEHGNYEIAKFLLEAGARVDLKSTGGNTALHYAVYEHHTEIAKLLCQYGADPYKVNKGYANAAAIADCNDNQELLDLWAVAPSKHLVLK